MRAVATALVLIAGAAVILWYGSTLNNAWVLGGLIGGLAALLLSIPISLTLFSHLSRRQDERLRMEEEEEMYLARENNYRALSSRRNHEVEAEGYTIKEVDEDEYDEGEAYWREERGQRRERHRFSDPELDVIRDAQRQTRERQPANTANNKFSETRAQAYLPAPRPQAQQPQSPQRPQPQNPSRRETKVLRSASLNTMSQHRMEARRTARLEAAQSSQDSADVSLSRQPSRRQTASSERGNTRRSFERDDMRDLRETRREPHTDYIENQLSRTDALRRNPQTDQIVRRVRTKDLQGDHTSDVDEGRTSDNSLNKPLVRRAPYMYPDDRLRQQLAKQIDEPKVRRSSRQEVFQEDEDFS